MARLSNRSRCPLRSLAASLLLVPVVLTGVGCHDGFVSHHETRERQNDYLGFASAVDVTPMGDDDGNGFPDGFDVRFDSPSQGVIELGWTGPLVVSGVPVELGGHPRMQNRFASVAFDETLYEVEREGVGLRLDFASTTREAWEPREHPHGGPGVPNEEEPTDHDESGDPTVAELKAQLKTWLRGLFDRFRNG